MSPAYKPGYQTTEFWLTVAGVAMSAASSVTSIVVSDAAHSHGAVSSTLISVASLVAAVLMIFSYNRARLTLKTATCPSEPAKKESAP